jgi:hypothetical protein
MEDDEKLWTSRELAEFLGYSPHSIATMVTKLPERLPPRVAGLGRPRWAPSVVKAWVIEQSATGKPVKRGRPRRTPTIID